MFLGEPVLGVKTTTSNLDVLATLGRLCLQLLRFLEENTYLRKAINEKSRVTNSWWIAKWKYTFDSYGLSGTDKLGPDANRAWFGLWGLPDFSGQHILPCKKE